MDHKRGNIFETILMPADGSELTEILFGDNRYRIERIVSDGQQSPQGFWYDQDDDEWVLLVQGEAVIEFEVSGKIALSAGDYIWIPSRSRHRITFTSIEPRCIWLAIYLS
jgi:cupin 2 domain-containing protein